jgi:glycosyltransferase involved in cell wall biosynthesis
MEAFIEQHQLQDHFFLLGTTPNPYPYFKACDIYVQTSRFEGFGLSIAEARLLNRPVVTTEFEAVYNQMIPGENGLVTAIDPHAVADAIERLLSDRKLYDHIVSFQQQEKKGNPEEINKFYALISQ